MLVETLIQNILEMQGVHVDEVAFVNGSREVELVPARGYAPCCGVCGSRAAYRDTPTCPLWGIAVYYLLCAPCRVNCKHCGCIHIEALPWNPGKQRFTEAFMESWPLGIDLHGSKSRPFFTAPEAL